MAQTILVTSGKGGVGKSVVCACLGSALARLGKRVLVAEGSSRSLDMAFGVSDRVLFDLGDFAQGRCTLDELLLEVGGGRLRLACAPACGGPSLDGKGWEAFARQARGEDFVLIEMDGARPAALEGCAAVCDRAVLVCAADPLNTRAGRAVSDALFGWGIADIRLCINQLPPDFERKRPVPDLDYMIDQVCAQLIAVIPYDPESYGSALLAQTLNLSNLSKNIFDNFAQRIIGNYIDLLIQ